MVQLSKLSKSFASQRLFEEITYHFPAGERIALVGANGAGKTTLLNIICGLDVADGGQVVCAKDEKIGYLPQVPNPNPKPTVLSECVAGQATLLELQNKMNRALARLQEDHSIEQTHAYEELQEQFRQAGGYSVEARAAEVLGGLGFPQDELERDPTVLSGGWRMRLELGKLLLATPDVLILDEPTNHLDLPSLIWVESYLKNFSGTLIFVSHDRSLLNKLATITVHLDRSGLSSFPGNFDQFLQAREQQLAQNDAVRSKLADRREKMERFVERFKAKATKAAQARSRMKMIARLRDLEDSVEQTDDPKEMAVLLPDVEGSGRIVLEIKHGAIGYQTPLCQHLGLTIEKGQKVAVVGANGIGKSTLLKTVIGEQAPLAGEFIKGHKVSTAYFAQDQTKRFDGQQTVFDNVMATADVTPQVARNLLGALLFHGAAVDKPTRALSGGEMSRLGLACLLGQKANFMLLDEPTNHLDMTSVQVLVNALEQFEGTLLFVSHDREFINSLCTHVFVMTREGQSRLFEGDLDDYERLAESSGFPNVLHPDSSKPAKEKGAMPGSSADKASTGDFKELKRRYNQVEKRVRSGEQTLDRLRGDLGDLQKTMATLAGDDYTKATELHQKIEAVETAILKEEEEWLAAAEEKEAIETEAANSGRKL